MLGKITQDILDKCLIEIKKDENQERIRHEVIDPTIQYIAKQLQPYIIASSVVVVFILLLLLFVVYQFTTYKK